MDLSQATQTLVRFLQIPSVSAAPEGVPAPGETEACSFLKAILLRADVPFEIVARHPNRPNLIACLKAGRAVRPPLRLISHIDVVAADPAEWRYPPFGAEIHEGRVYARGALDTKHLTVMELYTLLNLWQRREDLNRDVYLIASADEECGSAYGMEFLQQTRPELFAPSVVVSEGGGFPLHARRTLMTITVGEKAVCEARLTAPGPAGPEGSQQRIHRIAHAVVTLLAHEDELSRLGSHSVAQRMKAVLSDADAAPFAAVLQKEAADNRMEFRRFRLSAEVEPASLPFSLKCLPGTTRRQLEGFLGRVLADEPVKWEITRFDAGFESDQKFLSLDEGLEAARRACREAGLPCQMLPMLALGRTDGRFFGPGGSVVYGFSPVLPADSFDAILPKVHGRDESLSIDSFRFGCQALLRFAERLCLSEAGKDRPAG